MKLSEIMQRPSPIRARGNWTLISLILFTASVLLRVAFRPLLFIAMAYAAETVLLSWNQAKTRLAYYATVLLLVFSTSFDVYPLAVTLLLAWDQGLKFKGKYLVTAFVDKTYELSNLGLISIYPMFGNNSVLWNSIMDYAAERHAELKLLTSFGLTAEAKYMRENALANVCVPIDDLPGLTPSETAKRYAELAYQWRMLVVIGIGMFTALVGGPIAGMVLALLILLSSVEPQARPPTPTSVLRPTSTVVRDGVYLVTTSLFGYVIDHGVGVGHNGVLHTPYHVSSGRPILYGKTKLNPMYVDIQGDISTYGGPPQFSAVKATDTVYVNCEGSARTTYKVNASYDFPAQQLCWQGVTKPGESGSPVWTIRDDKMHLLGMAGRYVQHEDQSLEFTKTFDEDPTPENYKAIITHPGSGKTRRKIPDLINRHIREMEAKGRKILVTGPTRVVCEELYQALTPHCMVGLNIKDSNRTNNATVQIAAHASALKMLITGSRKLANLGMVILDEAHFNDTSTILLRRMLRSKMEAGHPIKLYEMSATLDGVCDDGSNYTILDIPITATKLETTVKDELEAGKRVLVFVPSLRSPLATKLMTQHKERGVVLLDRARFESAMKSIKVVDNRLIISTDIAECGINIPDLDTVVDSSEKFTYVSLGGIIQGKVVTVERPSQVQRRGRVGREKAGTYYYVPAPMNVHEMTAAESDAEMLSAGRDWSQSEVNWPFFLSDKQFQRWLDLDKSPLAIHVLYGINGIARTPTAKADTWRSLRGDKDDPYYTGCSRHSCGCAGHYKFYDERVHDEVFGSL